MTLRAKRLEFDCVFLPGWEEGLFPSQKSMDESGLKGLEEERRLCESPAPENAPLLPMPEAAACAATG